MLQPPMHAPCRTPENREPQPTVHWSRAAAHGRCAIRFTLDVMQRSRHIAAETRRRFVLMDSPESELWMKAAPAGLMPQMGAVWNVIVLQANLRFYEARGGGKSKP